MVPPPNELCSIPGLGLVPDQEIRRYKLHPKPGSSCFEVLTHRGHQHRTFFGALVGCSRRYIYATISSADAREELFAIQYCVV
ncbi:hypothetical protein PoB_003915700 [Plakobranchus ocellatus]|uniref:Uncharacterized protein n=1 Tax=Plakobranchus ocellatus TaxID=259542 RepID=A0AAV4AZE8_9GAST|nr:hypothetical protein PoB_003915700 [Plakobranchus ocellatus]